MVRIGVHLDAERPVVAAMDRGADCVQFFLGDPQGFKIPPSRDDEEELRGTELSVYVHAPYLINLASGNNRIRIPSRKLLADTVTAAARFGAAGVIVHGGHVTGGDDEREGFVRWRKGLEQLDFAVPVLLENTAGGNHAMARRLDTLARLWEHIGDSGIGFCLDTCHAHAGGEELGDVVDRVKAITGRIDLVHCNDSKDPAGSGRDRHENLGAGQIGVEALVGVVRAAGAPVICETPDAGDGLRRDVAVLREHLGARGETP